eukprot:259690-Pleurochrysis_carterae.AAC.1
MPNPPLLHQHTLLPAAFTGSVVAGRDDDARAFPADSPFVIHFRFLPWEPLDSFTSVLPGWDVSYLMLLVCDLSPDPAT